MDQTHEKTGPQLLLIGLDAGSLPVLESLFDRDRLPTLERLFDTGASGPLESQIPPWTASAWPSMYTGKNPGKHGVFDFLSFDGYDWEVVNATHVRERAIWELLSDNGISSVVVNVPVTHPARSFDGALIPGMTAPENPQCHPDGILEDVESAIGEYRIYPQSGPEPPRSTESYQRTVECRGAAFRYLLEEFDPGFGFLQFQQTDSIFHERPGDTDLVEAVYEAVDREIERTLEAAEPETVMIVSDHGIGRMNGCEFRVNEFFREHGYVTAQSGGEGMPTWSRAFENDLLDGEEAGEHDPGLLERGIELAARGGLTTQRIAGALDRVGLKEPIGRRIPNDVIRAGSEQVDFPESIAYVRSKSELGVRLNVEGREPAGRVSESAYHEVRSELIEQLRAIRTPSGDPMFEAVEPRETYFQGPHVDRGPDIVTVPHRFDNAIVAGLPGSQFGEPVEPWNHKRTGVIAAHGTAITPDVRLGGAHLFDVAPTICSLFDVPVDDDMDGEPLPIVEPSDSRSYPAYQPGPRATTSDAEVQDRLSDLGYL